jgi:hypothetical protein
MFWWAPTPNVKPGSYDLNITINGTNLVESFDEQIITLYGTSSATAISPLANSVYTQGEKINFTIDLQDLLDYNITGAIVTVSIRGSTYTLNPSSIGIYTKNVSTVGFPIGNYNATISISHNYLNSTDLIIELSIKGVANVAVSSIPSTIYNHGTLNFTFTITDKYGNPINLFNYSISFANSSTSGTASSYEFWWAPTPNVAPGSYWLNVTINGTNIIQSKVNSTYAVYGAVSETLITPSTGAVFSQGDDINFTILVQDLIETTFILQKDLLLQFQNIIKKNYLEWL